MYGQPVFFKQKVKGMSVRANVFGLVGVLLDSGHDGMRCVLLLSK
jgi:hypothetical protein